MSRLLWVALGGALGALIRAILLEIEPEYFPFSTVLVNIAGCAYLAVIVALVQQKRIADFHLLFQGTGIAGALTTFSMFSAQSYALFLSAANVQGASVFLAYVVGQVIMAYLAFSAAYAVTNGWLHRNN